jgi:hypothetical protein
VTTSLATNSHQILHRPSATINRGKLHECCSQSNECRLMLRAHAFICSWSRTVLQTLSNFRHFDSVSHMFGACSILYAAISCLRRRTGSHHRSVSATREITYLQRKSLFFHASTPFRDTTSIQPTTMVARQTSPFASSLRD